MIEPRAPSPLVPPPTPGQLFLAFAGAGLSGFGGVLPWARRVVVDQRRWMSQQEFNEAFAFCQFLPGPNIVNFTIVFGARSSGIPGAIAALSGILLPPMLLIIGLGALYVRYGQFAWAQGILSGLTPAAAGLIIAVAARMAEPMIRRTQPVPILIGTAIFIAIGLLRLPMLAVLAAAIPMSIALAAWRRP